MKNIRIRNLVQTPQGIGTVVSTDLCDDGNCDIVVVNDNTGLFFRDLDNESTPLSLNDEWMFLLGFEKNGDSVILAENNSSTICLERNNDRIVLIVKYKISSSHGMVVMKSDFKYVHEIQNIYFDFTGKEIDYEPDLYL